LAVEHKRQPLEVALPPAGDVGDQERPPLTQHLQHRQERLRASADLLHRDDVEAAHHLGDAQQVAEVTDRRVAGHRPPFGGQPVEGADVPRPDQQVLPWLLGWDHPIKRSREGGQLVGDIRWWRVGDPIGHRSDSSNRRSPSYQGRLPPDRLEIVPTASSS